MVTGTNVKKNVCQFLEYTVDWRQFKISVTIFRNIQKQLDFDGKMCGREL